MFRTHTALGCSWFLFAAAAAAQMPLLRSVREMLPPDDAPSSAVALGDVDGDGDVDAFVGTRRGTEQLFRNDGSGVFTRDDAAIPYRLTGAEAVMLFDMDGDRDLDAYVALAQQDRLLQNDGSGHFADVSAQLPAQSMRSLGVANGDLDRDGHLDIVVAGGPDLVRLYMNNGSGVFVDQALRLGEFISRMRSVALGDVNGDGWLDIFFGGDEFEQDRLYLANGAGGFVRSRSIPAIADGARDLKFSDLDVDGDLDLVVAYTNSPLRVLWNDGTGSFQESLLADGFWTPPSLAVGDLDLDGDDDVLLGNDPLRILRVFRNDGGRVFTEVFGGVPGGRNDLARFALEDLDGDGDLDAYFACGAQERGGMQNRLFLGDGRLGFADGSPTLPPNGETFAVVPLDAEGDGDLDVLVSVGYEGVQLYRNDGSGAFEAEFAASVNGVGTNLIAVGDVDGDGDADAIVGELLWLNDGAGRFTAAPGRIPIASIAPSVILLADANQDGDLDLFLGRSNATPQLYQNDGHGTFVDVSTQVSAPAGATTALAVGDVDLDGDLDWIVANGPRNSVGNGETSYLLLNDGFGRYQVDAQRLPVVLDATADVVLFDADGDGDLDLYEANRPNRGLFQQVSAQDHLYINDGRGFFTDATANVPIDEDAAHTVVAKDIDGDGDLDLILSVNDGTSPHHVPICYRNDGAGVFERAPDWVQANGENARDMQCEDFDGDGDPDLYIANSGGPDRLLVNVRTQLALRSLPRLGQPLIVQTYGPPLGATIRFLGMARIDLALPPLGTLRIDPSFLVFMPASALDAEGRATSIVHVPDDITFLGATIYTQALVAAPLQFTNLEIETFSAF